MCFVDNFPDYSPPFLFYTCYVFGNVLAPNILDSDNIPAPDILDFSNIPALEILDCGDILAPEILDNAALSTKGHEDTGNTGHKIQTWNGKGAQGKINRE